MHSASCGMRFAAMQVKMKYMQEGNYNFFCVFAFLLKDFQLQCGTKSFWDGLWPNVYMSYFSKVLLVKRLILH